MSEHCAPVKVVNDRGKEAHREAKTGRLQGCFKVLLGRQSVSVVQLFSVLPCHPTAVEAKVRNDCSPPHERMRS